MTGGTPTTSASPPDPKPTPKKTLHRRLQHQTRGLITAQPNGAEAPRNVQSIVYLIGKKFYGQHRLPASGHLGHLRPAVRRPQRDDERGWADVSNQGDENLAKAKHATGMIAMANSGKNTNGSQFFFITKDSTTLPKNHTVIGKVTKGMDVLQKVAAERPDNATGDGDGRPNPRHDLQDRPPGEVGGLTGDVSCRSTPGRRRRSPSTPRTVRSRSPRCFGRGHL